MYALPLHSGYGCISHSTLMMSPAYRFLESHTAPIRHERRFSVRSAPQFLETFGRDVLQP